MDKKGKQRKKDSVYSNAYSSKLSSKNQVTIPIEIRESIGAEPGDQVVFTYTENNDVIVKVNKKDSLLSLYGSMPPKGNNRTMDWSDIRANAREEKVSGDKE